MLGIELILNFNFPFFSRSIPEFWSRWHISLSAWLNDYVFTPLALSFRHRGKWGLFYAILITFIISGFWHGAGYKFIVYGAYFGLLYIPQIFSKKGLKSIVAKKHGPLELSHVPQIIMTFTLVCIGFVFFRANDLNHAIKFYMQIIHDGISNLEQYSILPKGKSILLITFHFVITELLLINFFNKKFILPVYVRRAFYLIAGLLIYWFLETNTSEFIYFQF